MKELHLICNAHLDPVWQWDWNEGLTSAIATFYSAAELADEYDYIFCHNEALLYEYIEEYDPALFERIKKLVEAGKHPLILGKKLGNSRIALVYMLAVYDEIMAQALALDTAALAVKKIIGRPLGQEKIGRCGKLLNSVHRGVSVGAAAEE